ncbi:MAG: type II secretion system protein [Candidatus Gastranaerophilales bacterium]
MFKIKKEFIPSNVIPNLFRNSIVEKFNGDEMLKQVQHDENPLLNRVQGGSRIPLRWRGDREVGVVSMKKRSAFTLAEVLITLGIIGVVAAMTIPNLISNVQSEALTKKNTVFTGRLEEAMNQMRFHEKLIGYASLEDFLDELGKYLKISYVCSNSELENCFPEEIKTSEGTLTVDTDMTTGIQTGTRFIRDDLFEDNMGVMFADGVGALINYKKTNCDWLDPYESGGTNRSAAGDCVSLVYDLNGNSGRNTAGSDVMTYNALIECVIKLDNGTCIDQTAFSPTPMSYQDCEANKSDLGITDCCSTTDCPNGDYWAGAAYQCGGIDNLLTSDDTLELGELVYANQSLTITGDAITGLTMTNPEYLTTLGFDPTYSTGEKIWLWIGPESSSTNGRDANFGLNYFTANGFGVLRSNAGPRSVCKM